MASSQSNRVTMASLAVMRAGQFSLEAHLETQDISVGDHFCLGGLLGPNSYHGRFEKEGMHY